MHFDSVKNVLYDLAIIKANSQSEALEKVGTNSKNQDISNEQIILFLQVIDSTYEEFRFQIIGIDKNWIEITLLEKPVNFEKFVNQIYEVWPGGAETSYANKQEMIDYLKTNNRFVLKFD